MRSKLVVGHNGRGPAGEALIWAANEAKRRSTRLVVVYAANYPGMALPPGPGLWEREPGALDAAREVTDGGVSEVVAAHPELSVSGKTVVTSPVQALVEESEDASLLVVGSRGRGSAVTTAFLGSVSVVVAAAGRCPVVVVKPGCAETVPGAGSPVAIFPR